MVTAIKEEKFDLTRNVSNIVEVDVIGSNTGHTFRELFNLWEYPVQVGESLVFTGEDTIAAYIETTTAGQEINRGDLQGVFDIVIMDSAKQAQRPLLNRVRYVLVREFQDADKLCHLDIPAGEQVIAREGERVCIRTNPHENIDASDSYFRLTCKRIRHTLFE